MRLTLDNLQSSFLFNQKVRYRVSRLKKKTARLFLFGNPALLYSLLTMEAFSLATPSFLLRLSFSGFDIFYPFTTNTRKSQQNLLRDVEMFLDRLLPLFIWHVPCVEPVLAFEEQADQQAGFSDHSCRISVDDGIVRYGTLHH